jgi:hypothetical protein
MLTACIVAPYQPAPPRVYTPQPAPPPVYAPPPPPPQAQYDADQNAGDVAETASEPPPPLPDYEQPPCPDDGYLWTPGYWHWSPAGYYWVPGTWVQPPAVGLLWTPGYWAFVGGVYGFHAGYWGPHVGFYGGVNYGFGYVGVGFAGGRWEGNRFAYNTAVLNVNRTVIHNTYNETIVNNVTINKVSYNGGPSGVHAAPTPQERAWTAESHVSPTPAQVAHVQEANRNPALFAHANGGHPAIAATARPAAFTGAGVISAHGAAPLVNQPGRGPVGGTASNQFNQTHTPTNNAVALQGQAQTGAPKALAPTTTTPRSFVAKPVAQSGKPPPKPPVNGNANNKNPHPQNKQEGEGRDK